MSLTVFVGMVNFIGDIVGDENELRFWMAESEIRPLLLVESTEALGYLSILVFKNELVASNTAPNRFLLLLTNSGSLGTTSESAIDPL